MARQFYVVDEGPDGNEYGRVHVYDVDSGFALNHSFNACTNALDIRGACAHKDTGLMYISYINTAPSPHRLLALNLHTEQVIWDRALSDAGGDRPSLSLDGDLLYLPNNENFPSSDHLMVINAMDGTILQEVLIVDETHNCQVGQSGTIYVEVKSNNPHLYVVDPDTYAVTTLGTFDNILGPYLLNGTETFAVANVYLDAGHPKRVFQVLNMDTEAIATATAPAGASVGDIATTGGDARGNLPHALWWSPDEQRLLTGTAKGSAFMQLWDMSNPMSPQYIQQIALPLFGESSTSVNVGTHWITGTIAGDYVGVGCQKNRHFNTVVFRVSDWATITQIASSGSMFEIEWNGSTIVRVGNQFQNGQVFAPTPQPTTQLASIPLTFGLPP